MLNVDFHVKKFPLCKGTKESRNEWDPIIVSTVITIFRHSKPIICTLQCNTTTGCLQFCATCPVALPTKNALSAPTVCFFITCLHDSRPYAENKPHTDGAERLCNLIGMQTDPLAMGDCKAETTFHISQAEQ